MHISFALINIFGTFGLVHCETLFSVDTTSGCSMLNKAVTGLNSPPVSTVLNWKSSYSGGSGPLIDMSQAVPGYPASRECLVCFGIAAANPDLARYGPVEGEPAFHAALTRNM